MTTAARSGAYEPATILILDRDGRTEIDEIEVLFNPTEYSLEKSVSYGEVTMPGMDTPITQFVHGESRSLSMDLLVDTYESGEDVREHVSRLDRLVTVDGERHAPPICTFAWGKLTFTSVVESLDKTFTVFAPDGHPVRAELSVTFTEYRTPVEQTDEEPRSSPDRATLHTVREGDSLWALAHQEYGDPGRWRIIAEENDIADPIRLEPGRELLLPAIEQ